MVRTPDAVKTAAQRFTSPLRSTRLTAHLGLWLGVCFGICFLTGLLSHLIQHPPAWFHWTSRPVMLYRFTQGLHVATGLASFPLLTAKVWSVFPKLFAWPPVRGLPHALERASIGVLSAAAVFELVTGLLNITYWYSAMPFGFIGAHYWVAWVAIGALVLHIAVKLPVIRRALGEKPPPAVAGAGLSRRGALGLVGAAAGVVTVLTVGQTVRPLRRTALLAPRLPDVGPQGIPVNKTAAAARVTRVAGDYRLVVSGPGGRHAFGLPDLAALPQHTVAFADFLALVGWDGQRVRVDSMEQGGAYRSSILEAGQARDPLTLLALRLNGETLHPDHGYPLRLIAPNRPGVLQTKWVNAVTVMSP